MNEMHSMFCSLADGGAVLTKKGEVVVLIARILDIYNVTAFVKSSVC